MPNNKSFQKIVATGFILSKDQVLIVQRSMREKFFPGVYEMPGGKVDFGERAEDAVKREVKEETNLDIKVFEPFYTFSYVSGISDGSKRHTIEIVFRCELNCPRDQIKLSMDHDNFKWIGQKEIDNNFGSTDQISAVIRKGFKLFVTS